MNKNKVRKDQCRDESGNKPAPGKTVRRKEQRPAGKRNERETSKKAVQRSPSSFGPVKRIEPVMPVAKIPLPHGRIARDAQIDIRKFGAGKTRVGIMCPRHKQDAAY